MWTPVFTSQVVLPTLKMSKRSAHGDWKTQVSRVESCSLKRVGTLNVALLGASCVSVSSYILGCFGATSSYTDEGRDECYEVKYFYYFLKAHSIITSRPNNRLETFNTLASPTIIMQRHTCRTHTVSINYRCKLSK